MTKRPYLVTKDSEVYLVNASNKSQAIRCIAERSMTAKPATGADVAFLMGRGEKLIEAVPAQDELEIENAQDL